MARTFDVIVVGLGAMGSAAAHHLSLRGKRVLGLEAFTAAHDKGSSHGSSRIIRQAYYEDPCYVPLVLRAYELWERLEADTGRNLLRVTGGLSIGLPQSRLITGSIGSAQHHMLNFEILDAAQIRKRFSQFRPSDDEVALYEAKAGYLRPEECILQHLAEASKRGAQLHFEEPILSWKATSSGDGVTVTSAKKTYHARSLILATGAWSPQILAQLGLPIAAFRRVMFWFDPTSGTDAFSPRNCPVYLWETEGGELFYGFPTDGGEDRGVKVAIHGGDEACTPDSIDREIRPSDELAIRSIIASRIPFLTGRLIDARTCMYTMTPDEHFIIEPHREFPQVSIAAGFSGHGFKFASVVGEILADLATEGKTNHNIDQFSSRRFDSAVPW